MFTDKDKRELQILFDNEYHNHFKVDYNDEGMASLYFYNHEKAQDKPYQFDPKA